MLDQGVITRAQFAAASATKLGLKRGTLFGKKTEPYVEQYVRTQLENDSDFGARAVVGGGLRVTTTIEPRLQKLAYKAMRGILRLPPCPGAPTGSCDPAAALVSIRPSTGEIVAMASTSKFKNTQFNFAQGQRQPGSTFKPFTLAAAIEAGINPKPRPTTSRRRSRSTRPTSGARSTAPGRCTPRRAATRAASRWSTATVESDNTVFAQLILDVGPDEVKNVAAADGRQPVAARRRCRR